MRAVDSCAAFDVFFRYLLSHVLYICVGTQIFREKSNFGEKWKFWWKIKFLVKNQNFGRKSNFLVENQIFGEKSNFWEKSSFWWKIKFWRKVKFLVKNQNYGEKSIFWWKMSRLTVLNSILNNRFSSNQSLSFIIVIRVFGFFWHQKMKQKWKKWTATNNDHRQVGKYKTIVPTKLVRTGRF